jgi:predicted PilT family ATPase
MALKELQKPSKQQPLPAADEKIEKFISKGGTLAVDPEVALDGDHRLTLRIPMWLMDRVDAKRKERVGKISRNLWILETIEKAASGG